MVGYARMRGVKAFDHAKPVTKAERVFAFVSAYRSPRPEIGERYAKTHAISAYSTLKDLEPAKAVQAWLKDFKP